MKQVPDVLAGQDDDGHQVAEEADGANDGDEDAVAPVGRLDHVVPDAPLGQGWYCCC